MLEALGVSALASTVYQAMLDHPEYGVSQLAQLCGVSPVQAHDCLDELGRLLLVRASTEHPGRMCAVSPEVGLADMIARQEADLAARQAQFAASRAAVTRLVAERAGSQATHGERLLGMDAIQGCIEQLARNMNQECLGVHPGASHRPEDLAAARGADEKPLARGVAMKTLYQDTTRNDPHTTAHAHWLLSRGSEVRTAPVLPQRLVIFDRAHALVPIDPADTRKGALHVTEPGIVNALLDLFDQAWATAVPLGAIRSEDPETGLTGTERELLRLLAGGLTDDAAGQRLGISSRTVSRHMASIMERLGAASRFEAGLKAAQRGWL
ncbi:helix-turn-helix transcriptional regulator [Streptomyces sp. CBMA156]|uniref:helix-turn-helix transcriptional regulator n=1 Tax=Streptomyces sp. CBMA156 TaxID=1930280 RepID=UPI0016619D3A|nr:LuxR family transcriptional regulator [Streptomyces sp. CBMA156]MBD0673078.1 helix-turn-helix transcriptional regulator [Streptomyces sp. CBMA156]